MEKSTETTESLRTAGAPEKAAWERDFEKALAAGRKEGTMVAYSSSGSELQRTITEGFFKNSGIKLEIATLRSNLLAPKLLAERNNGLFLVDIYFNGVQTLMNTFKPKGLLDPIEPELILPEVRNPEYWLQNQLPFLDKAKMLFALNKRPSGVEEIIINTNLVKENEITSLTDLLDPKWKGKIVMMDPFRTGGVMKWFTVNYLYHDKLPKDFWEKLAKQELHFTEDFRLHADWVAKGKFPVGIGGKDSIIMEFIEAGAPFKEISVKDSRPYTSSSATGVLNKRPHPNATRVFLNWFLGKEGQTIYSRIYKRASARLDVPVDHLPLTDVIDPRLDYVNTETEEFYSIYEEQYKIIKEIFKELK